MPSNTIIGEHMLKALACCEPVASKAGESMRFVRLLATKEEMSFEATDCEMWARYKFPGQFEPVECALPVEKWASIVKANKKAAAFSTDVSRDRMKVSVGNSRYTIPATSGTAWREEPSAFMGFSGQFDYAEFLHRLKRVAPSMGYVKQCIKPPVGAGVFVASDKEGLKVLAPSCHRVAKEYLPAQFEAEHQDKVWGVLPRRVVNYLTQLGPIGSMACLWMNANNFMLNSATHQFLGSLVACQTLEGGRKKIPDMRPMLDHSKRTWSAKIRRETLVQLLLEGGVFSETEDSEGKSHSVLILHFDGAKVVLQSEENNLVMSSSEAECQADGAVTIKTNGDYVKDMARVLDEGEEVELALTERRNLLFVVSGTFVHSIALMNTP